MCTRLFTLFLLLFAIASVITCRHLEVVQMARSGVLRSAHWARTMSRLHRSGDDDDDDASSIGLALADCVKLYSETEPRLSRLISARGSYSHDDAVTWLSGSLASHRTCVDGLEEKGGLPFGAHRHQNLTLLLGQALDFYVHRSSTGKGMKRKPERVASENSGLLASWNAATSKADLVVAQDGSGNYTTINDALGAASDDRRIVVYVKSGVYVEKVEIGEDRKNVMFVGDGMDKTIVSGSKNVIDGSSTLSSATFGVSGDGFWARDMTFENTAGPEKHQAVAMRVSSDLSVFYRCSFKGYQDTLYVHSLRQFYRDCRISGTVDFIFGDASAVFQNCDILINRPMGHQSNMITAQGRDNPSENTGISIINSRVVPSPEFSSVKGQFKNFLGRPWKQYSRTVFMKTELDGSIDPRGWTEWSGGFALSTLFYGEFMNWGSGASVGNRVKWPGFHVLNSPQEANAFSVSSFIQGDLWIPETGVPFSAQVL